jgi:hypothetical protein
MEGSSFDEPAFFGAIASSGSRALLIGRRALILLGLPVITADYDFWLHRDDIESLNQAISRFGLYPTRSPEQARKHGRYVLENDERIDVMVARACTSSSGEVIEFDAIWANRQAIQVAPGIDLFLPDLRDLMATKQLASRPKDAEDIRLLQALIDKESP